MTAEKGDAMSEKKRLFTGIKVEFIDRTLKFYKSAGDLLNESEIKWIRPENMHVTVKFFGDISTEKIPQMSAKLKAVAGKFNEFEPLMKGVGLFKDFYHPKILWFGLRNCMIFDKLKNEIENSFGDLGFEVDYRQFTPHLTVGRFKGTGNVEQLKKFINMNREIYLQPVPVKELILFESLLSSEGSEYKIVEKFPLGIEEGFRELKF
jgi:2'-5' RNA ligase